MSDPRPLSAELEERLARYRAGAMDDGERAAFEREVLGDEALAEALYGELSLDAVKRDGRATHGPRVTPLPVARPPRHASGARVLALAAALAIVSVVLVWRSTVHVPPPAGDGMRGAAALTALEPAGALTAPPERFRWTRDPGAARYRVELFDLGGNNRGTAVATDTTLAFTAVAHDTLSAGEWRVVAIGSDGLDRPSRSRAAFRVAPR